jgi:hypothetical protein
MEIFTLCPGRHPITSSHDSPAKLKETSWSMQDHGAVLTTGYDFIRHRSAHGRIEQA